MTESFSLVLALNALWGIGLIDAWVRSSAAEQNTPPKTVSMLRAIAAGTAFLVLWLLLRQVWPGPGTAPVSADRTRLFLFKLGLIGCAVTGLDAAMRYVLRIAGPLASRQTLVHGLVGFAVLFTFPIRDNLRLGIDLGGGTLLTYTVRFDEAAAGMTKERAAEDLIATLQKRVDPNNVMGLIWNFEGDKLTIQMPAPKVEIRELREKWQQVREKIAAENIESARLIALFKPGAADASAAAELKAYAAQFPRRQDAVDAVKTAAARALEAEKAVAARKDMPEELKKAAAERDARVKEFGEAVEKLEKGNLSLVQLEEALRLPAKVGRDYRTAVAGLLQSKALPPATGPEADARLTALAKVGQERPERKDQLLEAVAAYDNYRSLVRTSVEDVEDLKRELQGAGVLSFHILPGPGELSPEAFAAAEKQLIELGRLKPSPIEGQAVTTNLGNFRWFRADDEDEWKRKGGYRLVRARDQSYILAWDADIYAPDAAADAAPTKRMTLKPGPRDPWKLTRVLPSSDENGLPAVAFNFDEIGAVRFGELTKSNIERLMMIVIDDRAITAPTIRSQIRDRGQISGRFTRKEVDSLVRKLAAGSLRAKIGEAPISEQTVGPSLGLDNQKKGLDASLGSLLAVGGFIIIYYRVGGLVASTALVFNLVLLLAAMVFLNASMTLAGIAGLALSISMSVDANVLIFERIRDERAAGIPLRQSVRNGYDRAFSAIVDGNVTVVIAGLILLWLGSGDVKSFGLTLVLGVSISMFTALFATRAIFDILLSKEWIRDLKFLQLIGKPRVNWMGMLPWFLICSGVANLWATDSFFGVPTWWLLLLLPPAVGIVALVRIRRGGMRALSGMFAKPLEGASYVVITLAGLGIVAGLVRSSIYGLPSHIFDIEFSTGTAVQTSFKSRMTIEETRVAVNDRLAEALAGATVTAAAEGIYDIEPVGLPRMTGVRFPKDDPAFADAALVQSHIRGEAARSFATAAVQSLDVGNPDGRPDFLIKTLEDNVELVDAALRSVFVDQLNVQEAVRPPGKPIVYKPVPRAGEDRGLLDPGANAPYYAEFAGGVLLTLGDGATVWAFDRPQVVADVERRISREINRVGNRDNIVSNFKVLGLPASRLAGDPDGTFRSVQILGRPPTGTVTLPPADSPGYAQQRDEWERVVAGPFSKLVENALSTRQAFERIVNFSPQVAAQFVRGALAAVFLAWLGIVAYLWVRFGEARWGIAGVICLVQDVCVSLGLLVAGTYVADTAVGRALLIDAFRIDLTAVAAILAIIGGSINDTIVVFDRIREVRGRSGVLSPALINDSINQMMSRTLGTNILVGLAVGVLYVFGGPGIHVFSFLMLVGTLVGTYSSIAIAAPLLLVTGPSSMSHDTDTTGQDKPAAPPTA
jgi:protein-export membrane protein SecD/preprotein translocase SecF subunit